MAASTVGPRGPYDLILQDKASSPSTSVGLVLDRDEQGKPRVREFRVPPVPPRSSSGALAESHLDPMVDYIYVQDDWSGGALQVYYRDGSRRYAEADGVDARWEGVLALGPEATPFVSQLAPAGSFEQFTDGTDINGIENWVQTGGAGMTWTLRLGSSTSIPAAYRSARTGLKVLHINASNSNSADTLTATVTTTALRSRTVTVGAWIKASAWTATKGIRLLIGGAVTTDQASSYVNDTATYTYVEATATLDATETALKIKIHANNSTSGFNGNAVIDDLFIRVASADQCLGIVEAAGNYYTAVGPMVLIWDETNDYWKFSTAQTGGTAATSIVSFKNNVYVAYGLSTAYIYGTDGSWTVASGGSGNDTYAQFFTVMDDRLWKNEAANTIRRSSATTPVAAAQWVERYTVGEVSAPITGLYMLNHSIVVGTETGLHVWFDDELRFRNVTNWFVADPNADNFARGIVRGGWLYTTTAKQGLMRFNGSTLEDLSELFMAPRYTSYGGRVKAITQDQHQLYLLVDTPTVDTSTSKTTRLMSLRELGGEWQLHTLQNADIGDINTLAVAGAYLYGMGRLAISSSGNYFISSVRWRLPEKSAAPYADDISVRALEVSGTVNLPIIHAPMTASLIKVELLVEDTDTNNTVAVDFGLDGAAPSTTNLGTVATDTTAAPAIVTLNASSLTTPTDAKADFWQFQLELTRQSSQAAGAHESPKVYMFRAHFVLSPTPVPAWEFHVRLGALLKTSGMPDPRSQSAIRTDLNTLENQDYPITLLEDLDQDDAQSAHYVRIREWERVLEDTEHRGGKPTMHGELYRLVVQKIV